MSYRAICVAGFCNHAPGNNLLLDCALNNSHTDYLTLYPLIQDVYLLCNNKLPVNLIHAMIFLTFLPENKFWFPCQ